MPKRASKVINVEFAYTATGILGKTPSNVIPTSFFVRGPVQEWWLTNGKREERKGNSEVLVPSSLTEIIDFLQNIPLGTRVVFKESGKRFAGKIFSRSYSMRVVKSK